jgi:chemotaxis protein MotB
MSRAGTAAGNRPVIVKKVRKVAGHGHHGGAWKVAYADFVTAMMAFFLLLWLLNVTTDEQRLGIANYFLPTTYSKGESGSVGLSGGDAVESDGLDPLRAAL